MTDVNHCLSKQLVARAQTSGQRIVLEELTGIRGRTAKFMHKHLHGWSFAQLRSFIEYKTAAAGVECVTVDPRYTSTGCSRCLHIGSRPDQSSFTCGHCGMRGNADLNAARGIARRHDLLAMGRYFCAYPPEVMSTAPEVSSVGTEASRLLLASGS